MMIMAFTIVAWCLVSTKGFHDFQDVLENLKISTQLYNISGELPDFKMSMNNIRNTAMDVTIPVGISVADIGRHTYTFQKFSDNDILLDFPDYEKSENTRRTQKLGKTNVHELEEAELRRKLSSEFQLPVWLHPDRSWSVMHQHDDVHIDASVDSVGSCTIITVLNTLDNYPPLPSYCFPLTTTSCNLRSAWLACLTTSAPCCISLPPVTTIYMNQSYGQLTVIQLNTSFHITIQGNGAHIQSIGSLPLTTMTAAVHPIPSFPYTTSTPLYNTSSATIHTLPINITLCPSQSIHLLTYPLSGDPYLRLYHLTPTDNHTHTTTGNTEQEEAIEEVMASDDVFGFGAEILYSFPSSSVTGNDEGGCRMYQLRVGCYANTSCTMTIYGNYTTITSTTTGGASTIPSPRFFYYSSSSDVVSATMTTTTVPILVMHNMTMSGFGSMDGNGGVFYLEGKIRLSLQSISFRNNTGYFGGILFANYANQVNLTNIQSDYSNAYIGGAWYFNKENTQIVVYNMHILHSTCVKSDSVMSVNIGNCITLSHITIRNCSSAHSQSSIQVYHHNPVVNVYNISVYRSDAFRVFLSTVTIQYASFLYCNPALTFQTGAVGIIDHLYVFEGTAIYAVNGALSLTVNHGVFAYGDYYVVEIEDVVGVTLTNIRVQHAFIGITMRADNILMNNVSIIDCTQCLSIVYTTNTHPIMLTNLTIISNSYHDASLVVVPYEQVTSVPFLLANFRIENGIGVILKGIAGTIRNGMIRNCTSGVTSYDTAYGGGLTLTVSPNAILNEVEIIDNQAATGGGLYLSSIHHAFIVACTISGNQATQSGGGVYLARNISQLFFMDSYTYQNAGQMMYQYTSTIAPSTLLYSQEFSVPSISSYQIIFTYFKIGIYEYLAIYVDSILTVVYYGYYYYHFASLGVPPTCFGVVCTGIPGIEVPALIIYGKKISISVVTIYPQDYYPDMKSFSFNIYPRYSSKNSSITTISAPTTITQNIAGISGGGINFMKDCQFVSMFHVQLTNNTARNSGGGMNLQFATQYFVFDNNEIAFNVATLSGGGIALQGNNLYIAFLNNSIHHNTATEDNGGGVMLLAFNGYDSTDMQANVSFQFNEIACNTAKQNGGGIYFGISNIASLYRNLFYDNTVTMYHGGAIYLNQNNQVNITKNTFLANNAHENGGAIALLNQQIIIFDNNTFTENIAGQVGGALFFQFYILPCVFNHTNYFLGNQARFGGAIASLQSNLWYTLSSSYIILSENQAICGSAIFYYQLSVNAMQLSNPLTLNNMFLESNVAVGGGTIYWIYDSIMTTEPPGVHSDSIRWKNNKASYGNAVATQAIFMPVPLTYRVMVYETNWFPAITIQLYDYYHQTVVVNNMTSVYPTIVTSNTINDVTTTTLSTFKQRLSFPKCDSSTVSLTGSNVIGVLLQQGEAVFSELGGTCMPNGNFTLQFQAKLGEELGLAVNFISPYFLTNISFVQFRGCVMGEYEENGQCRTCPQGSFSVVNNTLSGNRMTTCIDCSKTPGIDECYGNQIMVSSGYWRRYDSNTAVFLCPLASGASCNGGNMTGDETCSSGYVGPLCAVCDTGYYLTNNECLTCDGQQAISPQMIALLVLFPIVGLLLICIWAYTNTFSVATSVQQVLSNPGIPLPPTIFDELYVWWKNRYTDMAVRMKIIVSTYQIVTSTASIFNVNMPIGFTAFSNFFSFMNFSFSSIVPIGCTTHFNFMISLLWTTLLPILLVLLLILMMIWELLWCQRNMNIMRTATSWFGRLRELIVTTQKPLLTIQQKYLNYILYVTYLILPSTTSIIFQTFICKNIDPNQEDQDESDWYLVADMSISCESTYYYNWLLYAALMVLIYPIGIPLLYFIMLYSNRESIIHRDDMIEKLEEPIPKEITKKKDEKDGDVEANHDQIIDHQVTNTQTFDYNSDSNNSHLTGAAVVAGMNVSSTTKKPPILVKRGLSENATAVSFLFASYQGQYWYWEIIETTRRIFLTAVMSVIAPGTSQQNVISIVFAVFYIRLYGAYQPYAKERNSILAEIGQVQIFFTFFMALLLQAKALSTSWQSVADILLVMLNFGVMLSIVYFQYQVYQERVKANNNKSMLNCFVMPTLSFTRNPTNDSNKKENKITAADGVDITLNPMNLLPVTTTSSAFINEFEIEMKSIFTVEKGKKNTLEQSLQSTK